MRLLNGTVTTYKDYGSDTHRKAPVGDGITPQGNQGSTLSFFKWEGTHGEYGREEREPG